MMGFGLGGFGFVFMLLFWVAIVVLAMWVVSSFFPEGRSAGRRMMDREDGPAREAGSSALEVARRRYAGGDITREEYQEIAGTLSAGGDATVPLREVSL